MDEYITEIDQVEDGHVVLAIPSLRLVVMGRTLDEARARARQAIAYRVVTPSQQVEPTPGAQADELQPPSSNAA